MLLPLLITCPNGQRCMLSLSRDHLRTITQLLVKHVISHHGVPSELLFDQGAALLSDLLKEMYQIRGIPKLNTTAYHPQMDGLVERFHRTLLDMLAKTAKKGEGIGIKNFPTCSLSPE